MRKRKKAQCCAFRNEVRTLILAILVCNIKSVNVNILPRRRTMSCFSMKFRRFCFPVAVMAKIGEIWVPKNPMSTVSEPEIFGPKTVKKTDSKKLRWNFYGRYMKKDF